MLTIRNATATDAQIIADFNCRLAMETENNTLDSALVSRGVRRGLEQADEVTYLVAEVDGQVVGQLMLTREWSDWRDGWMYWLQSVYVLAEFRGQNVFRRLLEHAKSQLHNRGDVVGLRLYVELENAAAIETYQRLGFTSPGYSVMELPMDRG